MAIPPFKEVKRECEGKSAWRNGEDYFPRNFSCVNDLNRLAFTNHLNSLLRLLDGDAMAGTFVLRCFKAPFFRFAVAARDSTLGRSNQCDFVVDHPSISRVHAKCGVGEKGLLVTDLDSRNGTFVDNQRIQETCVLRGQMLRFGRLSFVVAVEDLELQEEQSSADEETDSVGSGPGSATFANPQIVELLSDAQRRVFDLLLSGEGEKGIARHLGLSPHTVHNHVRAIFGVFDVHSRAQLVACLLGRAAK